MRQMVITLKMQGEGKKSIKKKTSASWLMVDVKANAGNTGTRASICRLGRKVWRLDNTGI